jgi:hypothetical protein
MSGMTPLPEADLVVSAGRGLKGSENWGIVEDLANSLGATTACSRPVADMHWRPHHEHVGQTVSLFVLIYTLLLAFLVPYNIWLALMVAKPLLLLITIKKLRFLNRQIMV